MTGWLQGGNEDLNSDCFRKDEDKSNLSVNAVS